VYEVELKFSVPDMRAIEQRLAAGQTTRVRSTNTSPRSMRDGIPRRWASYKPVASSNGIPRCRSPGLRRGLLWGREQRAAALPGFIQALSVSDGILYC